MPGRNGGTLRRGNPGNRGTPPSAIRETMRRDLKARVPLIRRIADNVDGRYTVADQLKALDLLAKYGLGAPTEVSGPDGAPFTVILRAAADGD